MELMARWRIALIVGLLTTAMILPMTAITLSTPPTLSPLGSTVAIDIVAYAEEGNVKVEHKPRLLAPEVGSTVMIFSQNLRVEELELIKERRPHVVYDLRDLEVQKIMGVVNIKLLYWGKPASWAPEGRVAIYVSGPSGQERYVGMEKIFFPQSPPASTESVTVMKLPIWIDRNLWAEGNGQYTLRFTADVDVTVGLDEDAINRAVGKANAFVGVDVTGDEVILRTMSATQDSIIKIRERT